MTAHPPISRLERRSTPVILRDLLADPTVAAEVHADPYLEVRLKHLLAPTPATHAIVPDPMAADPTVLAHAASHPNTAASPGSPSTDPGDTASSTPATAASLDAQTPLPVPHRIYALYCEGHTMTAIARDLALDRGTVSRHIRAVEAELAEDHTADLVRLRLRAVQTQYAVMVAAWEALAREELREGSELAAAAIARANGELPPAPYRAQRARLLSVISHAARTAAQLQGLFAPATPAAICSMPASAAPLTPEPGPSLATAGPAPAPTTPHMDPIPHMDPATPAVSSGMPASTPASTPADSSAAPASAPASTAEAGLPITSNATSNATAGSPAAPPPASASPLEGPGERSSASPLRRGEGPGERSRAV